MHIAFLIRGETPFFYGQILSLFIPERVFKSKFCPFLYLKGCKIAPIINA